MKLSGEKYNRFQEVLKAAHREKTNADGPDGGGQWESRVMRRIRMEGHAGAGADFLSLFNEFVWRLAPVSAVVIIALSVCMARFDLSSDFEMAAMLVDDLMGFSLAGVFNIQTG